MEGSIQVYYGNGRGKTTASLGLGIRAAGIGKQVIMVQFLKKQHSHTLDFLQKLEPELRVFRFERTSCKYSELSQEEQKEQKANIMVALGYTKKVLDAAQCDLLILDDIFGLIDFEIISIQELMQLISLKRDSMSLILTGRHLPDEVREIADCIYHISTERERGPVILESTGKEG